MKTVDQRLKDEQSFHNEVFETDKRHKEVGRFYSINESIHKAYENLIFRNPKGKVYLEYGCGMDKESRAERLAKEGATVHGIDISDYAIDHLSKRAKEQGLSINYQVMNAEEMTYPDDSFDVIYGTGILHHLDLEKALESISKKLKKGGQAVFIEPLGHNLFINGYRNRTPDIRTDDEHPLLIKDFDLAKRFFNDLDVRYFYLTTLGLPVLFKDKSPKFLIRFFNAFDRTVFTLLPFMRKYAWQVVVKFNDPK